MLWSLQWKVESVYDGQRYLSLKLEIEVQEVRTEKLGDIWITLVHLSFKNANSDTSQCCQLLQIVALTAPVMLTRQPGIDYDCYIFHPLHPTDETRACILPAHRVCLPDLPENGSLTCSLQLSLVNCTIKFVNGISITHRFASHSDKIGAMLSFSEEESKDKYSDVTLLATAPPTDDGRAQTPVKFYAHKVILAAHSPVFAKMLKHNMKEGVSNEVSIPDVELMLGSKVFDYFHKR